MKLSDIRKIYFIGIGGIGMSALARYFKAREVEIHGYDKTKTILTKKLEEEGMQIHYEEDLSKIPGGVDLVVYTPAVPASQLELQFFLEHNFPLKKRSEVLGIISRSMKTIAVAGTHGKTTASSILTHLLHSGGIECTSFLGGIARNYGSNFVSGKSEWVVAEADEYDRSFLHLSPDIAVILSMDADHLDIYGDLAQLHESGFEAFAKKLKPGGSLWVQYNWSSHFEFLENVNDFGVGGGAFRGENIRVEEGIFVFDYHSPEVTLKGLGLALPGRYNVENAVAAISVALQVGIAPEDIERGLASFKGIKRRFEFIYRDEKLVFINDYAHHPSELTAVIGAARELFPGRKITGIFQPHLYSRTRDFAAGFAEALDGLDELLLMDIYPARELPIEGVSSEIIIEKMKNLNVCRVSKTELLNKLKGRNIEVLLTLGAGDIDTFVNPIKKHICR